MTSTSNKSNSSILVVDIETTGFGADTDFIIEIGAVSLDLRTGEIATLFDSLIREQGIGKAQEYKIQMIHGDNFPMQDILKAPSLEELRPTLQKIFDQYNGRITAWNRTFDFSFLNARAFDWGDDFPCPMQASKKYLNLPFANGNRGKQAKVQEAWDILFPEDPQTETHRGLDDAIMEAKIIYKLQQVGGLQWLD